MDAKMQMPSAFICVHPWLILAVFDPQQFLGLTSEAAEFFVVGLILLHPPHALLQPLAGLVLFSEAPVGHRQKEGVETQHVAFEKLVRLAQGFDSRLPIARTVVRRPERVPAACLSWPEF